MVDKGVDNTIFWNCTMGIQGESNELNLIKNYEQVFADEHVFVYTVIKTNECLQRTGINPVHTKTRLRIYDILEYRTFRTSKTRMIQIQPAGKTPDGNERDSS
jgi:hypothetical protein